MLGFLKNIVEPLYSAPVAAVVEFFRSKRMWKQNVCASKGFDRIFNLLKKD